MKQIPFRFYRDFFSKEIGRRELVELYSVTGGVPKYIESFRGVDDVYRGIEKSVLNSSSYLYDEPNFLLSKEVSEVGTYFSILKAVAAGNRKSGEIAAALNVRQTGLSKYLKVLERLDVLERVVPDVYKRQGIECRVVDMRWLKPLDAEAIAAAAACRLVVTVRCV